MLDLRELETRTVPLTQPVPVNRVRVDCENETFSCGFRVFLVGT